MKIACTADWHIHQFQDFSKQILVSWDNSSKRYYKSLHGKEMNSRLFNILDGIIQLRDYCRDNGIRYVLNAGDVFHKRGNINVDTFNAAHKVISSFRACGVELITIAGNHDQVDSSDLPATSIHTFSEISTIVEKPSVMGNSYFTVICLPYSRNKEFLQNRLDRLLEHESRKNCILLAHLGVTGGAVGSGMYTMNDEWSLDDLHSDEWKYVVLGHYHRPQLLSNNTFYCGTPVQNSFNDELPDSEHKGYNGFFVIDTDKKNDVQFIPIYEPRFITIQDKNHLPAENFENYYRLKLNSDQSDTLIEVNSNVRVELEKDYSEISRSSIGLSDDFQSAVKKYVEEKSPDNPEILTSLGLDILSEAMIGGR